MSSTVSIHGRNHRPGGVDPIPGMVPARPSGFVEQVLQHPALVHYWRMGASSGDQPDVSGHPDGPVDLLPQVTGAPGIYDVPGALVVEDDGAWEQSGAGATATDHFYTGIPGVDGLAHRANFPGTSEFSVECWAWINPLWTASVEGDVISCGSSGSVMWALRLGHGGSGDYYIGLLRGLTGSSSALPLIAGQWYHLVATYDGTTSRIYVNGELFFNEANAASIPTSAEPVRVGVRLGTPAHYFYGRIDEVALYIAALSADEILAHYTVGIDVEAATGDLVLISGDDGPTWGKVTSSTIADDAVTPAKLEPGDEGETLRTLAGEVVWSVPTVRVNY